MQITLFCIDLFHFFFGWPNWLTWPGLFQHQEQSKENSNIPHPPSSKFNIFAPEKWMVGRWAFPVGYFQGRTCWENAGEVVFLWDSPVTSSTIFQVENIKSLNENFINKAHLIKTANEKSISVSLHLEPLDSCVFIRFQLTAWIVAKGAGIKGTRKTHVFLHVYNICITPFFSFFSSRTVTFVECDKKTLAL